ncbi:MAG: creatininase family protein [Thermoanaerobaculia bacterium]
MPVHSFAEMTWEEVAALEGDLLAVLPTGAIEAHGPHLPLGTDEIIAVAMAENGARRLSDDGHTVLLLPPLVYTSASFAAGFAGTLSVRPETVTELIVDVGSALAKARVFRLAIANAHLEPAHLASLHSAAERLRGEGLSVAFPDLTRKPWGSRLTDEFKSGACHAGRYEGSIVMAARADLVRTEIQRQLPPNPTSLSTAIGKGIATFEEAGGERAYFGDPAAASEEEGRRTIDALGEILRDAVVDARDASSHGSISP